MTAAHGHTFNLFEFCWLNYADKTFSRSINLFSITSWDNGEPHSSALLGFLMTDQFMEFSFLFFNFGTLFESE